MHNVCFITKIQFRINKSFFFLMSEVVWVQFWVVVFNTWQELRRLKLKYFRRLWCQQSADCSNSISSSGIWSNAIFVINWQRFLILFSFITTISSKRASTIIIILDKSIWFLFFSKESLKRILRLQKVLNQNLFYNL